MKHAQANRWQKLEGYTLVELMVVVAIVAILAAIGLPAYSSYMKKSKVTEAVGFLADIKARQESYRADFGQYCNASGDASTWNPGSSPSENYQTWDPNADDWDDLGASPPGGKILFSYQTVAGTPAALPNTLGFSDDRGYAGTDFWFISRALGDLDGDGDQMTIESYSASSSLYTEAPGGADWE